MMEGGGLGIVPVSIQSPDVHTGCRISNTLYLATNLRHAAPTRGIGMRWVRPEYGTTGEDNEKLGEVMKDRGCTQTEKGQTEKGETSPFSLVSRS